MPAAVDGNGNPVVIARDEDNKPIPPLVDKDGNPVGTTLDETR